MRARVCYDTPGDTKFTQSEGTNQISKGPSLLYDECVFRTGLKAYGSMALLCSKQKNLVSMNDINRKFSPHGRLLVDYCDGRLSVARTCMLLTQYRRLVGCDLESDCDASSLP